MRVIGPIIAAMGALADSAIGYELLDAGVRRRLERFGGLTIDRPAPGADGFRLAPDAWADADLRFDPGPGWSGHWWPADPWPIEVAELIIELRPTSSGGLGLYPEHVANLPWLERQVAASVAGAAAPEPPQVLNLFAHTGLATLALARAGAAIAHVDGAKSAVAWARHNAELSNLVDRPIRWLVDDAATFVAREARRGRRYDGIVLDPPAFGRGGGRDWRLEADLPDLLATCAAVAAPAAFVLFTTHSEAMDARLIERLLGSAFPKRPIETVALSLTATSGSTLHLGWAARIAT
jgi:23S rRNA (cytosine1962-C5)-methyltransferase